MATGGFDAEAAHNTQIPTRPRLTYCGLNLVLTKGSTLTFSLQKTEIDFVLQNKSDDPIKLDWNLVSFIQSWGTSQAVIHKGIKLADKQAPKAPSVVPPKAKIEDIVVPVENVEFANGEWRTQDLLLDGPASLKMVGQEFSIFMPLDLGHCCAN